MPPLHPHANRRLWHADILFDWALAAGQLLLPSGEAARGSAG